MERYKRTILDALTASTTEEERWGEEVSNVQWTLNFTTNKATGKTPRELMFGCRLRGMNDKFLLPEVADIPKETNLQGELERKKSSMQLR